MCLKTVAKCCLVLAWQRAFFAKRDWVHVCYFLGVFGVYVVSNYGLKSDPPSLPSSTVTLHPFTINLAVNTNNNYVFYHFLIFILTISSILGPPTFFIVVSVCLSVLLARKHYADPPNLLLFHQLHKPPPTQILPLLLLFLLLLLPAGFLRKAFNVFRRFM